MGPEEAKAYRKDGLAFYRGNPGTMVTLIAMCLAPMIALMAQELAVASQDWQKNQEMSAMHHGPGGKLLDGRKWPLLLAAGLTFTSDFMLSIASLCAADRYSWVPPADTTLDLECYVVRLLSRLGASVYQLLILEREKMPFALFLLLLQGDDAAEMIKARWEKCQDLFDSYSASYVRTFGVETLCAADGLLELSIVVMLARTSTVILECRNAHISRWLRLMSSEFWQCRPSWPNGSANASLAMRLHAHCKP